MPFRSLGAEFIKGVEPALMFEAERPCARQYRSQ